MSDKWIYKRALARTIRHNKAIERSKPKFERTMNYDWATRMEPQIFRSQTTKWQRGVTGVPVEFVLHDKPKKALPQNDAEYAEYEEGFGGQEKPNPWDSSVWDEVKGIAEEFDAYGLQGLFNLGGGIAADVTGKAIRKEMDKAASTRGDAPGTPTKQQRKRKKRVDPLYSSVNYNKRNPW